MRSHLTRHLPVFFVVAVLLLLAAACGGGGGSPASGEDHGAAARTVEVDMHDIAFDPSSLDVRQGETVRFVFTNTGQVVHDAFIGTEGAQADHEMQMRDRGHGAHSEGKSGAATANALSVKPGKRAALTHTFGQPGQVLIGCHQPGHYTGGMRITVTVA